MVGAFPTSPFPLPLPPQEHAMTNKEAAIIASRLNGLMKKIRAKEIPFTTDTEGNVVEHITHLSVEEIESDLELIFMVLDEMSKTDEEREAEDLIAEQDAAYFRGLGNLR